MTAAAFAAADVELPPDEERCQRIDTNGGARCYCRKDHDRVGKGGCKFTVPGVPSPSTASTSP